MNTRKGFTLVELLVVIAILAILATVSVVGYTSFINGAEEQAAITEAEQIDTTVTAALVLNSKVSINNGTTTIYLEREGNSYKVVTPAEADQAKYVAITNLDTAVAARLSESGTTLVYTSAKGIAIDVKAGTKISQ